MHAFRVQAVLGLSWCLSWLFEVCGSRTCGASIEPMMAREGDLGFDVASGYWSYPCAYGVQASVIIACGYASRAYVPGTQKQ